MSKEKQTTAYFIRHAVKEQQKSSFPAAFVDPPGFEPGLFRTKI